MIIYIFLLIAFFLLRIIFSTNVKGKKFQDKRFAIIMAVLMGTILGLRGKNVGIDTNTYIIIFEDIRKMSFRDVIYYGYNAPHARIRYYGPVENLFVIINKLTSIVSPSPNLMFLTIGLATCLLFTKFIIDNCDDYSLPVFTLMCDMVFMNAFTISRQMLAMSVGIQAYALIKKKDNLKALLIILVATGIHTSCIIYLSLFVIVFLSNTKHNYKLFKYCLCICIMIPLLLPLLMSIASVIVSERYASYFTLHIWETGVGGIVLLWGLEIGLLLRMYFKRFKINGSFEYSICVMFYITLAVLSIQISALGRVGMYFRAFLICFFPTALKYIPNKYSYMVRAAIYLLLAFLYLSYAKGDVLAYSFFWKQK